MRKLTLNLESIDVQSFDVTPAPAPERGTVRGHGSDQPDCTNYGTQCPSMYDAYTSCKVSDLGTCVACPTGYTCYGGQSCVTCVGAQCEEPY